MIDWSLAERIAATVAGDPPHVSLGVDLAELAADSERLVGAYTGLVPAAPLPAAEWVSRSEWVNANVGSLSGLLDPLVEHVGEGLGPLSSPLRAAAGYAIAAEVGVVFGYLGKHVLGQYELVLLAGGPQARSRAPGGRPTASDEPAGSRLEHSLAPARLLFVAPNLDSAVHELKVDREQFMHWVALHEITHALQFGSVAWLREHLAGMLRELLEGMSVSLDTTRALRLPTGADLRKLAGAVGSGDLLSLMTTPEQRQLLDRVQATMAVLEGYAEHVMDAVGADVLPSLPSLRAALNRRRSSRSAPARMLQRLLGLDLKLRQYELGKQFCDAVARHGGIDAVNRVWTGPEAMPTLEELAQPADWLRRTHVPVVTK
ncbi:MAG TPA: zinc-dependent metalloprotease [Solirubrobacteraceae bacterium]|nr:zinc-dependent metalloprotease [Solirubrobacteraceae bacterium]